jgi:hypothetical protein
LIFGGGWGGLFGKKISKTSSFKNRVKNHFKIKEKKTTHTADETERRTKTRKREREMAMVYLLGEWYFASREW